MIDTGLDRTYVAKQGGGAMKYEPLPEGDYLLRVKEIKPWQESKKTIKVIQRDEDGKAIVDDKGEKVTELVKDCKLFTAQMTLEVMDGEYMGRRVFHSITTHPNMPFSIPNFLHAVNMTELKASEIPTKCLSKKCLAKVVIDKYDKIETDKNTGMDTTVEKTVNKISSFKTLPESEQEEDSSDEVPF